MMKSCNKNHILALHHPPPPPHHVSLAVNDNQSQDHTRDGPGLDQLGEGREEERWNGRKLLWVCDLCSGSSDPPREAAHRFLNRGREGLAPSDRLAVGLRTGPAMLRRGILSWRQSSTFMSAWNLPPAATS